MYLGLREFEALGGKFEEQKLIRKGLRYNLYLGILTIDGASCIGYVKKCKNGAVFVTRMQNITNAQVTSRINSVAAVLERYIDREERNEEILYIQERRKRLRVAASVLQLLGLFTGCYAGYMLYNTHITAYIFFIILSAFVVLLMNECKYSITGLFLRSNQ